MPDIRWEEGFEDTLEEAIPDPELRAEVIESIEWVLALRPKARSDTVFGDYRVYTTEATGLVPKVRVCFRIEGDVLALHSAERVESSPAW